MHFQNPQGLRIPVLISVYHNALSRNTCKAVREGETDSTRVFLPLSLNFASYKKKKKCLGHDVPWKRVSSEQVVLGLGWARRMSQRSRKEQGRKFNPIGCP